MENNLHERKQEYFKELDDIIEDHIFIGNVEEDIGLEIRNNKWSMSVSQELNDHIQIEDWIDFFEKLLQRRSEQIKQKNLHGMVFYLWFEAMPCHLCFNLISDFHNRLPFGGPVRSVEKLEEIITMFISSPHHDGIPFEEGNISEIHEEDESDTTIHPVKAFVKMINSSKCKSEIENIT